jgi:hypothetical protein
MTQNHEKGKKRSESPVNEENNKKRKVSETQGTFILFSFFKKEMCSILSFILLLYVIRW